MTADVEELRAAIAVGIDQAERGEVEPWDRDEIAAEVERRYERERKGRAS